MFKDHDYVKLNSVNPLYLIINKINRYLEKVNGNKYLTVVPNNESKEIIIKKNMKNCGVKSNIKLEQQLITKQLKSNLIQMIIYL